MTLVDQTTVAYERDAEATRRRLSNSLDELADNLTPGRMLDEVLSYAKGGGASFLKGLGNAASTNPVPTLLIAAGAAMFLSGKGRIGPSGSTGSNTGPSASSAPRSEGPSAVTTALKAAGSAASSVGDAIGSVASTVGSAVGSVASGLGGAVGSGVEVVGDAAGAAAGAVGSGARSTLAAAENALSSAVKVASDVGSAAVGGASEVVDELGSTAGIASNAATEGMASARNKSTRLFNALTVLVREQPLAFAAAGLAVGVAIAAALPRTKIEDEAMGETSDALKEAVADAAAAEFEVVMEAAEKAVGDVADAAANEGVTPASAVQAVKDLGQKVKNVVEAGGEALTNATHQLAGTDAVEKGT